MASLTLTHLLAFTENWLPQGKMQLTTNETSTALLAEAEKAHLVNHRATAESGDEEHWSSGGRGYSQGIVLTAGGSRTQDRKGRRTDGS